MTEKKSNKLVFGLMIAFFLFFGGLAMIGIVAAIAVPSYIQFVRKSKASEAKVVMTQIQDRVSVYYLANCKFPPSSQPSGTLPEHGDKSLSNFSGRGWDDIGFENGPSMSHFQYQMVAASNGTFSIIAKTDFTRGGPIHTEVMELTAEEGCSYMTGSTVVTDEFQ